MDRNIFYFIDDLDFCEGEFCTNLSADEAIDRFESCTDPLGKKGIGVFVYVEGGPEPDDYYMEAQCLTDGERIFELSHKLISEELLETVNAGLDRICERLNLSMPSRFAYSGR